MQRRLVKLALTGALVGGLLASSTPAHAGNDSTERVLAMVGSDTTTFVMEQLASHYNTSVTYNPDGDKVVNIPPLLWASPSVEAGEATQASLAWIAAARSTWPTAEFVPSDGDCSYNTFFGGLGAIDANGDGDQTDVGDSRYTSATIDGQTVRVGQVPPNGSGAGRTFALDSAQNPLGCVDLSRSSSAPSVAQQANFDTWAFALDAIGWVTMPGYNQGVTALSQAQLNSIYTCSTTNVDNSVPADGDFDDPGDLKNGEPKIRFWGELNGNPTDTDRIKPYRIQLGSGTGSDVATTLLGLASANNIGSGCTGGPDPWYPTVQEHDCRNVADVDKPAAICFYGYSRHKLQAKALEADKRNGAKFQQFFIGAGTPLPPTPSTITETPATNYDGTRLVYTLIVKNHDGSGTDLPGFNDAITFAGVDPDSDGAGADVVKAGFACNGGIAAKIIRTYGLVPLKKGVTDTGDSTYGSTFCRHNKYAL
ncbi:MAG TPA: hypothetical protein VFZ83_14735 [Acidimicrobiia bacterium]|nr:hypothetical protein [Acidimicrobiia bacterium]